MKHFPIGMRSVFSIAASSGLSMNQILSLQLNSPSPIQKLVIDGGLRKKSELERSIYAAAEYIIRNSLLFLSLSNGQISFIHLPEHLEHQCCCEKTPSWIKYHSVSNYHKRSLVHLSNVFDCSVEGIKEFLKDKSLLCLIGIDNRLDAYLDRKYRKIKSVKK